MGADAIGFVFAPSSRQVAAGHVRAIVLDSHAPGSGEMFDWSLAEGAPSNRRVILAGGLTPENVSEAIERVKPWGVDVSTGVEDGPGRKDARKVRDFVRNARAAAPR